MAAFVEEPVPVEVGAEQGPVPSEPLSEADAVSAANLRATDFASSTPSNVYEPLRQDIEARDPTSASLITKALEGDDEEYRDLISGDSVRKQLVLLAGLKDQASRRVADREDEEMRSANREADLRTNNMMKEREFMEEAESEFREKMTRIVAAANAQQLADNKNRGDLYLKVEEISQNQMRIERGFQNNHKQTMDELAIRINQLNKDIAQLSEANFMMKSAAIQRQSGPMMLELKMDEADAAALAAAASAEEASQSAMAATQRAMDLSAKSEATWKLAEEANIAAKTAALDATNAATIAQDPAKVVPPPREVEILERKAAAPKNMSSLERRQKVDMADIDKAMAMHPSVDRAVAFPVTNPKGGQDIAVAIQTKRGARVSESWLKLHSQSLLPSLAIPSKFYWVPEIPANASRADIAASKDLVDFDSLKKAPTRKRTVTLAPPKK